MTRHVLKTVQPFFDAVWERRKTFEIRENDRGFQVGDTLTLVAMLDENRRDASREPLDFTVTYVLSGWGLKDGFVALGLGAVLREEE